MLRDKLIEKHQQQIDELKTYPKETHFEPEYGFIVKLPECPKCGRTTAEGYELTCFIYTTATCKCGYTYTYI